MVYSDLRSINILLNKEIGGVIIINFERAVILEVARQPLSQLVTNKRKRVPGLSGIAEGIGKGASKRREVKRSRFIEDILIVQTAFIEFRQGPW